jgi:hypothetical protein
MAKVKKSRKDNQLRQQGEQDERYLQKEISPLDGKMKKQSYAMKVSTLLNAAEMLSDDLSYLSSLVEDPDPEFLIKDAVVYSHAVACISNQLNFIVEELTQNDLSSDQEHVKLSEDEVFMLSSFADSTEESLYELEKVCGISLRNN